MRLFISVLCLLNCVRINESVRTYTIGALFHEDSQETETAFKCAVQYFNRFNNDIFFKTNIKHVSKHNSFTVYQTACRMLDETDDGLAALFGPPSTDVSEVVNSLTSNLELPNVQIHKPSPRWPYRAANVTSINIYPNPNQEQKGIAKIVQHLQWRAYVILYQYTDSLVKLQDVIGMSKIQKENVILRQLKGPDFRIVLKEIKQLGYAHIILDCDVEFIVEVLKQAKELDMLGYLYNYLFTSLDAYTLDLSFLDTVANITTIRIIDTADRYVHRFLRECNIGKIVYPNKSDDTASSFIELEPSLMWDATNFFMTSFHEIFHTGKPQVEKVVCGKSMKTTHGFQLANYMKIRPIPNTITGQIRFENNQRSSLVLQVAEMIKGQTRTTALWNSTDPEKLFFIRTEKEQQELIDVFIKNTTFIVYSKIVQPYLMYKRISEGDELPEGNDVFEGYALDIIDHIAKTLNFSYKFMLNEQNKPGSYDKEKKSWDGLIKDILDRRAHLAICDLTITEERRSAVDFSLPFMTLGISILHSKPKPQQRNIFAFLDPLHLDVWIYILAGYVGASLVMYLLTRLAPGDWENPNPADTDPEELENIWDLKNTFWLILGSTMSQGCDILPKGISSRTGVSMWWFMILIINSSYTANLAAFLTTSGLGVTIDSAEALAKQTKIKYGCLNGGATQAFFKNQNFSTYQRMWAHMSQAKPSVFVNDNAEGVKRVKSTRDQQYAFLMESSSVEYETERDCELRQVGGRLDNKGYGIAMPVNAPYRGSINMAILKMQEDGTLRRLKEKWWKEMYGGGACVDEPDSSSSDMKLALANIGGVFVVLFFGLALAGLIALGEFFWNVHVVSVEEHKTYKQVLISELEFASKVWMTKKRTYKPTSSSTSLSINISNLISANSKLDVNTEDK